MKVNQVQLSEITGYSVQTLVKWQADEGMPVELDGQGRRGNEYDTAKVFAWFANRAMRRISNETPKDRLDRVKADMIEMQLAEKCEQLVLAADVERVWKSHIIAARIELLALPEQFASEVHSAHQVKVDPQLFRSAIDKALLKLESLEVDDESAEDDESSSDAIDARDDSDDFE